MFRYLSDGVCVIHAFLGYNVGDKAHVYKETWPEPFTYIRLLEYVCYPCQFFNPPTLVLAISEYEILRDAPRKSIDPVELWCVKVTAGAIPRMLTSNSPEFQPILQVVSTRPHL